ncbi:hypothetical protein EPI10_025851 [Gossypium australe]|uniref:Uncharacterized protein n=1 Tax=Gossypium australe TaxID=47621 RepID=A0A5B6W1T8_9ROSI|nr:hypothetical protein EPI10_025851 [Gossypium australe]
MEFKGKAMILISHIFNILFSFPSSIFIVINNDSITVSLKLAAGSFNRLHVQLVHKKCRVSQKVADPKYSDYNH